MNQPRTLTLPARENEIRRGGINVADPSQYQVLAIPSLRTMTEGEVEVGDNCRRSLGWRVWMCPIEQSVALFENEGKKIILCTDIQNCDETRSAFCFESLCVHDQSNDQPVYEADNISL